MYAYRRLHVKSFEHDRSDERYSVHIERGGQPVKGIRLDHISHVDEEVMHWRTANHIHAWFVDNVQGGYDNCKFYHVRWELLDVLIGVCDEVLAGSELVSGHVYEGFELSSDGKHWVEHRKPGLVIKDPTTARTLMPYRAGYFFGNCDYDQWYLGAITETRDWAKRMVNDFHSGVPGKIYYRSSW